MSWLALWAALEVGMMPGSGVVEYPEWAMLKRQAFYTELDAEVRAFDVLFVGGMVRTEVQRKEGAATFTPELSSYGFTAGVRFGPVELAYIHVCQHPTLPYFSRYHPVIRWDGWYDGVYLRVETRRGD